MPSVHLSSQFANKKSTNSVFALITHIEPTSPPVSAAMPTPHSALEFYSILDGPTSRNVIAAT